MRACHSKIDRMKQSNSEDPLPQLVIYSLSLVKTNEQWTENTAAKMFWGSEYCGYSS